MNSTILQTFGPSTVMFRVTIAAPDVAALGASTTGFINLPLGFPGVTTPVVPRGTLVKNVRIKHTTAFSGTSITGLTVSIGSAAGSATTFTAAFNIFQAVADGTLSSAPATAAQATYAADTIQANFTSTGANLSAISAGSVNIDIELWLEPDLTATAPVGTAGTAGAPTTGGLLG